MQTPGKACCAHAAADWAMDQLKSLMDYSMAVNDNMPAVLLAHSMGKAATVSLHSGHCQAKSWADSDQHVLLQTGAMDQLKGLIEHSVRVNDNKPAVLLAHSMGNLVAMWLMQHQTPAWVQEHVAGFFSVSAPFLGSVTALKGVSRCMLPRLNLVVVMWLLQLQTPAWVQEHVAGFFTVSAPFLGSVTALQGVPCWSVTLSNLWRTSAAWIAAQNAALL